MCEYWRARFPFLFDVALHERKVPDMATIQDLFTEAAGDDASVAADQKKLADDTAADLAAHQGLNAAVSKVGPSVFTLADGTFVFAEILADGSLRTVVSADGSKTTVPVPDPTPVDPPAPPVTPPTA